MPKVKPTTCNGKITGYCVEFEGTDAIAEFHSGTQEENLRLAELFARSLKVEATCPKGDPFCPCPDGDQCHYAGENPMTMEPQYQKLAQYIWDVRVSVIPMPRFKSEFIAKVLQDLSEGIL
jgi:hypothetical protein